MTDIQQHDISDEPRAFSVDEALAASHPEPEPECQPEPEEPAADEVITGTLDSIEHARLACETEIERLVNARLDINADIKRRRRQLNMLERMARILGEPDDD